MLSSFKDLEDRIRTSKWKLDVDHLHFKCKPEKIQEVLPSFLPKTCKKLEISRYVIALAPDSVHVRARRWRHVIAGLHAVQVAHRCGTGGSRRSMRPPGGP